MHVSSEHHVRFLPCYVTELSPKCFSWEGTRHNHLHVIPGIHNKNPSRILQVHKIYIKITCCKMKAHSQHRFLYAWFFNVNPCSWWTCSFAGTILFWKLWYNKYHCYHSSHWKQYPKSVLVKRQSAPLSTEMFLQTGQDEGHHKWSNKTNITWRIWWHLYSQQAW